MIGQSTAAPCRIRSNDAAISRAEAKQTLAQWLRGLRLSLSAAVGGDRVGGVRIDQIGEADLIAQCERLGIETGPRP